MFRSVSHVRDRLRRWPWLTPLGYQNHPTYRPTTSYNMDENRSCHVKYETFQLWGGSMILNVLEDAWTLGSSVTRHLCGKLIVEHLSNATIWGPFPLHLRFAAGRIQPISRPLSRHADVHFFGLYDLVVHGTLGHVRAVVHKVRANNKLARFEVPAIPVPSEKRSSLGADSVGKKSGGFFLGSTKSTHYLGVSENSVPLNPMVNDHYPY